MVSNRTRAQWSLGNKINDIASQTSQNSKAPATTIGTNAIGQNAIAPNSITSEAIAPGGVDDASVNRGAVGGEHLGVIDHIESSLNLEVQTGSGGYVQLLGDTYTAAPTGTTTALALDANKNIVLGANSGTDVVILTTDWNNAKSTGFYRGASSTPNAPDTSGYHGWVVAGQTVVTQMVSNTTADAIYKRTLTIATSTWSAWVREPTAANTPVLTSGAVAITQGGTGATSASQALTNLGASSGVYTATPLTSGTPVYLRLARIDGAGTNNGANIQLLVSGLGDYGGQNRGNVIVSMVQRGDNNITSHIWGFGMSGISGTPTFYTRKISTFVFELWMKTADWQQQIGSHLLSASGSTFVGIDSSTTTAPSSLITVPIGNDLDSVPQLTSGAVPVTQGGTGATSSSTARTNLGITPGNIGAANSSHTHNASDINSGTLSESVMPAGYQAAAANWLSVITGTTAINANGQTFYSIQGTVTFPSGRFSSQPSVVVTPNSGVSNNTPNFALASSITNTGFTITYLRYSSNATVTVNWIAMAVG